MLDPVAELRQHGFGNIERVLCDEINPDAFGADQTNHLFDFFDQGLGRAVEEQVRFIEEEHQLRFFRVAHFRQFLKQLRQQPEQEYRIKPWRGHQLVGGEDIDHAPAIWGGADEIADIQRRFAEQVFAALAFQHQQAPLDRTDGGLGHVAVMGRQFRRPLGDVSEHCAQVLEVEQKQAFVIGQFEQDVQDTFLGIVEFQEPRQKQRPDLGDGGPDRMALLTEQIPEDGRERLVGIPVRKADCRRALFQKILGNAGLAKTGKVPLDVCAEDRHAGGRKAFRQDLQ